MKYLQHYAVKKSQTPHLIFVWMRINIYYFDTYLKDYRFGEVWQRQSTSGSHLFYTL